MVFKGDYLIFPVNKPIMNPAPYARCMTKKIKGRIKIVRESLFFILSYAEKNMLSNPYKILGIKNHLLIIKNNGSKIK